MWRWGDGWPLVSYGLANMGFMYLYYRLSGCPDSPACDLDGEGHPYVYSVVDWGNPPAAAAASLGGIAAAAPIFSGLVSLSRMLDPDAETGKKGA